MEVKLSAQKREKNEKLDKNDLAAVIYGKNVDSQSLKINKMEFEKVFSAAGESNLIKLDFGTGPLNVLVKDTQKDVMKGTFTHVDFYQVNMKEKLTVEIPLHFDGEPKAVKELGATLVKELHEIKVECLPTDLVDHIIVDVSVLQSFDDVIRISDLPLPKGMEILDELATIVARIEEPKEEEAPAEIAVPEAATPATPTEEEKK